MILLVVWPVWPPAVVWYTQVFPTATGNGIELALTNDFASALRPALVAEVALWCALPAGVALEASEVTPAVAVRSVALGISGVVAAGTPHPARARMAAPASTAFADPCLLM